MRILKKILLFIAILIAIPLVAAIFMKKDFSSERNITIHKPLTEVFDFVKYLKNQDQYGVWNLKDPGMKKDYQGIDGTVGFVSMWDSEQWDVGKGTQTITNIEENARIDTELRFDGDNTPMYATLLLEPEGENQTKVSWRVSGTMPYPFNFMSLFFDIGDDLEQGLKNLKQVLEK